MFYFATRVNVAAVLITNQVCSVERNVFSVTYVTYHSNMQDIKSFLLNVFLNARIYLFCINSN